MSVRIEERPPKGRCSHGTRKAGLDARVLLAQHGVHITGYRVNPPRHYRNRAAATVELPAVVSER